MKEETNPNKTFEVRWISFYADANEINTQFKQQLGILGYSDIRPAFNVLIKHDELNEYKASLVYEDAFVVPDVIREAAQKIFNRYFQD
jgi:hypothetical protein